MAPLGTQELPSSYTSLPFKEIRISHYPPTSPSPTPIVILTLYRPDKYNSFTTTLMEELESVFNLFDVDDRVKCIVLTGAGRMFCAGADLETGFVGGKERINNHRDTGGRVTLAIHRCRKPTIAAINGSAVGVGITMTLPCAIRIAAASAKIGFVFARRGLVMEACSSFFLLRLIGLSRAMRVTTTGATYRADDQDAWGGLFAETIKEEGKDGENVLKRALEIADDVVKNTSTVSTYLMREMMYRNPGSAEGTHLLDSRILYELFSSADNKEGIKAFLEKRPANFIGTMDSDAPGAYPWWNPIDTGGKSAVIATRSKL
ncbi:MAG: hypothetical protein M1820_010266 [Bogoriella megaspora]|nr:MAG: hypothetical protein M1820_010266 [Bogoriella megaspora]